MTQTSVSLPPPLCLTASSLCHSLCLLASVFVSSTVVAVAVPVCLPVMMSSVKGFWFLRARHDAFFWQVYASVAGVFVRMRHRLCHFLCEFVCAWWTIRNETDCCALRFRSCWNLLGGPCWMDHTLGLKFLLNLRPYPPQTSALRSRSRSIMTKWGELRWLGAQMEHLSL